MDPQPQPDGEVPDAAKVVGAGEGDESIVGEGVRMQESLACHTAHLQKISFSLCQNLKEASICKQFKMMLKVLLLGIFPPWFHRIKFLSVST